MHNPTLQIDNAVLDINTLNDDIKQTISATTSQLLVVIGDKTHTSYAKMIAYEKTEDNWVPAKVKNQVLAYPAIIGKHGIAAYGSKKEGDKKTPAGTFYLGEVFSYYPLAKSEIANLQMDFRYITSSLLPNHQAFDKFIDDPATAEGNYNSWVIGATTAKSFEIMHNNELLYEYGVIINYNMHPVISNKGSAIFLHIWADSATATFGCVALKKPALLSIINWLNKTCQPQILIIDAV